MIAMNRPHINSSDDGSSSAGIETHETASSSELKDEALFILLNEASIPLHAQYLSKHLEKSHMLDENDENVLLFAALANSLVGLLDQLRTLLGHETSINISLSRVKNGFTIMTFGSNITFAEIVEDLARDGTLASLQVDEGNNLVETSRKQLISRLMELIATKEAVETYFQLKQLIEDLEEHLQDKIDFIIVYDLNGNYITSTLKDPMAVTRFGKGILSRFVKNEYKDKTLVYSLNDNIKLYYRSTGSGSDRTALWHVGIKNYVFVFFKHRIKNVPPGVISFRIESFMNAHRQRFDLPYPPRMLECANKYLNRTMTRKAAEDTVELEQHLIYIETKKTKSV